MWLLVTADRNVIYAIHSHVPVLYLFSLHCLQSDHISFRYDETQFSIFSFSLNFSHVSANFDVCFASLLYPIPLFFRQKCKKRNKISYECLKMCLLVLWRTWYTRCREFNEWKQTWEEIEKLCVEKVSLSLVPLIRYAALAKLSNSLSLKLIQIFDTLSRCTFAECTKSCLHYLHFSAYHKNLLTPLTKQL